MTSKYQFTFKKVSILFFQIVVVVLGIGALVFMLWEPQIEGRNVGATLFEIYFRDPFLVCVYIASIPFFVALYRAFNLSGYVRQNKMLSQDAVKAARTIKYCARLLVGFVVAGEAYLFIVRPGDDIAGGVFMGLLMIVVFGVIAIIGAKFERILKNKIQS